MTQYRIMDKTVLEEAADFTLSMEIPARLYPAKNPDGTTAKVSLKVEAPTNRHALALLTQIHEQERIVDVVASYLIDSEEEEKAIEADPSLFEVKLDEVFTPFKEFGFQGEDEEGRDIAVVLTAPTGLIAIEMFQAMTTTKRLNTLLASFMPLEDDDEDDFYYGDEED